MDAPSARAKTWQPGLVLSPDELTPATIESIKLALSPAQTLGLTAFREAASRLEPDNGWVPNPLDACVDVMCVVDNRAKDRRWSRLGHKGVCLQESQFSCWAPVGGEQNFSALLRFAQMALAGQPLPTKLHVCIETAQAFIDGRHDDLLQNSTHYYATWMPAPPKWAEGRTPVVERFGHRFFNNVP